MAGKGKPRKPADPKFPRRINTRKAQEAGELDAVDVVRGDFAVSDEEIGIQDPTPAPQSAADPVEEPDTYYCYNCRGPLNEGDDPCPYCEVQIDWTKIAVIG